MDLGRSVFARLLRRQFRSGTYSIHISPSHTSADGRLYFHDHSLSSLSSLRLLSPLPLLGLVTYSRPAAFEEVAPTFEGPMALDGAWVDLGVWSTTRVNHISVSGFRCQDTVDAAACLPTSKLPSSLL